MKRDATAVIWRTVVFAGAMLGAPACSKNKPAPTAPSNTAQKTGGDTQMAPTNGSAAKPDPTADGNPCGGTPDPRPRGTDDEGGSMGRGFVLS
jgi:hypothetical protein